jgi:hypothetical protein
MTPDLAACELAPTDALVELEEGPATAEVPATAAVRPLRVRGLPIEEAQLVRIFRRALARRGASPQRVYHVQEPTLFTCAPCLEAATASVGLRIERVDPASVEEGVLEPYLRLAWYFDRVEARDAPVNDSEDGEVRVTSGHEARFFADRALGLWRLAEPDARPEDAIWLWTFSLAGRGEAACVAAPARSRLRPLLSALHREDREHQGRSGLVLVGNRTEGHSRRAKVSWDDVFLPSGLRDELRATVKEFFGAAALYRRHRLPHRRGLLLAGPPGNGKTSIIRAIASDVDLPVVVATLDNPHDVHNTRNAFARAAELAPAVVCFEDLDALVGDGPGLSQFLNLLDGLEPLEGLLVVATTNRPDKIDPAIAKRPSRFDRVFVIPEPDRDLRRDYVARQLGSDAPAGAAERLADETAGYSVAFLKELLLQARLAAVRRGDETVTDADLDAALASTREHLRLASAGLQDRGGLGFQT